MLSPYGQAMAVLALSEVYRQSRSPFLKKVMERGVRFLERAGYCVLPATDGAEALNAVEAHFGAIDLLVTDVVLPGLNGREISDVMTARFPGLRTLFISGYTSNIIAPLG